MTNAPTNIDVILARLDQLPPGKRYQASMDSEKIAAGARKARERGAPWATIMKSLKELGVSISLARLKKLVNDQIESEKAAPASGAEEEAVGSESVMNAEGSV